MSCFSKTFPFFNSSRTSSRVKYISPILFLLTSTAYAGPEGGQVVGGAGSIERVGDTTTILQETDRMAIDWQSYDVGANERVHYIQPDSSSLSLNRILSNNGSQILGRIDANGHVILVNPNGIIFGENATINAGGLLASGLTIDPQDFLNGEYAFSAIDDTDGSVINRGMLNASLGGSVSLLGKRVENDGLISADLGSVTLAAGEGAVVTFDDDGLMGLRVTEAVLQSDLGVDPAVVNNGEISAENGQVLISASVSEDIFSDAVNHGALELSSSVVVHDDGSFTLGEGADVVNAGTVDVSGENAAGEIVVLGENVTNSGDVRADISGESADDIAGEIEIHSRDTTFISGQGEVSATAHEAGQGGDVKVLGDNVGLIDDAVVDASGANGGGQVLIGGDETGANPNVRNAQNIFLGEETLVSADATDLGDGGRVITFAENIASIRGDLSAIGGLYGGNGGFVETSGLAGFEILNTPSIYASNGLAGEWLIDPIDIDIVPDEVHAFAEAPLSGNVFESDHYDFGYGPISRRQLWVGTLLGAFSQGVTTTVRTSDLQDTAVTSQNPGTNEGRIRLMTDVNYSGCSQCVSGNAPTLILEADGNVDFNGYSILGGAGRSLNVELGTYSGRVSSVINSTTTNSVIQTGGGYFSAILDGSFLGEHIDINSAGGDVQLITRNTGDIYFGDVTTGSGNFTAYAEDVISDQYGVLSVGGLATFTAYTSSGVVAVDSQPHNLGRVSLSAPQGGWGSIRSAGALDITYANVTGSFMYFWGDQGITNSGTLRQTGSGHTRFIADSGYDIDVTNVQASNITFFRANDVTATITGGAALDVRSVVNADITAGGNIVHYDGEAWGVSGQSRFDVGANSITLDNPANNFGSIYIEDANNATIYDANSIVIDAALLGAAGSNTLTVNTNGDITGSGRITANSGVFDTNGAGMVSLTNVNNELDRLAVGNSTDPTYSLTYSDASGLALEGVYLEQGVVLRTGRVSAGLLHNNTTNPDIFAGGGIFDAGTGNISILPRAGTVEISEGFNTLRFIGNEVDYHSNSRIWLGSSNVTGDFTLESDSNISDGNITSAEIVVFGEATFTAGTFIELDEDNHDFSILSIGGADEARVHDRNSVVINDITATEFTVEVEDTVTQLSTSVLNISDYARFYTRSNTGSIMLDRPTNNFVRLLLSGGSADVVEQDGVQLSGYLREDLDLVAGGDITGGLRVSGEATFTTADTRDISLETNSTNFGLNVVNVTAANNVTINDYGSAVVLGDIEIQGDLTVYGGRGAAWIEGDTGISDVGSVIVGGNTSLYAERKHITLDGNHDFMGSVSITDFGGADLVNDFTINDINSVQFGNVEVAGDLNVTAGGNISEVGVLSIGNDLNIDTSGGPVQLADEDHSVQGIVNIDTVGAAAGGDVLLRLVGGVSTLGVISTSSGSAGSTYDAGDITIQVGGVLNVNGAVSALGSNGGADGNLAITAIPGSGGNPDSTMRFNSGFTFSGGTVSATGGTGTNNFRQYSAVPINFYNGTGFGRLYDYTGAAWEINGVGDGTLGASTFENFGFLYGNASSNTFSVVGAGSVGIIYANGTSDSLVGPDGVTNTWTIDGPNAGDLNGISFQGMESLTGGDGDDYFQFTGTHTGGSPNDPQITGTINGMGFVNQNTIETCDGCSTRWEIDGTNSGNMNDASGPTIAGQFQNIQRLIGSGEVDRFVVQNGGSIVDIEGRGAIDIFDLTERTSAYTTRIADIQEVEQFEGNNVSELWGPDLNNTWLFSGGPFNGVAGVSFRGFNSVVGGSLEDVFQLSTGANVTSISGGGGDTDRIMGLQSVNDWRITGENLGTYNGVTGFSSIEHLEGDGAADTFDFESGGRITGSVDGGAAGLANEIIGRDASSTWSIRNTDEGSVATTSGVDTYVANFYNIRNLTGGSGDDDFDFTTDDSDITGSINGGGHNLRDEIDFSAQSSVSTNLAALNVSNIENIRGNGSGTLTGENGRTNNWVVSDEDEGTINGINFFGYSNLTGGNSTDIFTIQSGGIITGTIDGAGGANDEIQGRGGNNTWSIVVDNEGELRVTGELTDYVEYFQGVEILTGGAGDDTFAFADGADFTGAINGGGEVDGDVLDYSGQVTVATSLALVTPVDIETIRGNGAGSIQAANGQTNTWLITGADDGVVDGFNFEDYAVLIGGDGVDTFTINDGVDFTGSISGGADAASQNTLTHNTSGTAFTLNSANGGEVGATTFSNIGVINGSGSTLNAFSQFNEWQLIDSTSGTINTTELVFTGMENLQGGIGVDRFTFGFNGAFSGAVDAGSGASTDVVNVSSLGSGYSLTLGDSSINNVTGAESVIAAPGATLSGLSTGTNVWTITGANVGAVSNGVALDFAGFTILQGSATAADQFTINDTATFTGELRGGVDVADNALTNNSSVENTWTLSATNNGTVGGTSFSNIRTLNGSGDDTLVGFNQSNTWTIDGANSGDINNDELAFTGMQRLTGNDGADEFIITSTGSVSGLIDGAGSGVQDRLNLLAIDTPVNVQIGTAENSNINVNNIELIDRPVAGSESSVLSHSLATVDTDSYTWVIDGVNSGNVAPTTGANIDNTIYFTNFGNAVGGIGEDLISYVGSGALTSFNGGGGSGSLTLNYYATSSPFDITIGETFEGVDAITINPVGVAVEDVRASLRISSTDTTANEWTIDGLNSGSVDTDGDAEADFEFTNFDQLFGGSGDDTFAFEDAGNITGQLVGGAGTNSVDATVSSRGLTFQFDGNDTVRSDAAITSLQDIFSVTANSTYVNTIIGPNQTSAWSINVGSSSISGGYSYSGFERLQGNAGVDTFQMNGGVVTNIDGGGSLDFLVANNQSNSFIVTGANEGNLNGVTFESVENLNGNDGVDTFTVQGGTLTGTANGLGGNQDRVIAPDAINVWVIDGPGAGSLSGVGFDGIEILEGGALRDTFRVRDGGSIESIEAGGTDNVLDLGFRTAATQADLRNSSASGVALFTGISSFIANPSYSNAFFGQNVANVWEIDAANEGEIQGGPEFTGFDTLQGGTAADEFQILGGSVATINGGAGGAQDTLIGNNGTNNWNITSSDGGTVTAVTSSFSEIERMVGNAGQDNFVLTDGAAPVFIDGGAGANDELNVSAFTSNVSVNLETSDVNGMAMAGFEVFTADAALDNTLTAAPGTNDWDITGDDDGTINSAISFNNFHNLTGNDGDDHFVLDGGTVTGVITGAAGDNSLTGDNVVNTWSVDGANAGDVTGIGNFVGIGTLTGNSDVDNFVIGTGGSLTGGIAGAGGNDSLTLTSGTHVWNVTGMNAGDLAIINTFDSIETLVGGSGDDTFNISDGAGASVLLDGGAGANDELNVSAFTSNVSVNLETSDVNGMAMAGFEVFTADAALDNTLTAAPGTNDWDITGDDDGTINSAISFNNFHNLTGNDGDDHFVLDGGTVTGVITGAGGDNSLTGDNVVNTWSADGANAGDVTGIGNFVGIGTLTGNSDVDNFVIGTGGSLTGGIAGAGGNDSLTLTSGTHVWNVTGMNAGDLAIINTFDSIETLAGGSGDDTFNISDGAGASVLLNGGAGANDELNVSAFTSNVSVNLETNDVNGMAVAGFEAYTANAAMDNTLTGAPGANDWQITGENDGRINDAIDFTDFHNLTGSSGDDDFTLASGGSVTGTINGGTGGSNSLTAGNVANAWLVDDANEGTVTGVTRFEAIGTLIGNGDIDNFVIGASGSLTGGIQGAGSNDSLTLTSGTHVWNVTGMNDGNLAVINTFDSIETLVGGSGEDTFNVADTAGASVLLDGGAGDSDELNVSGFTSNVAVNLETNTVNGMAVAGFEAYTANAAMDNTLTGASGANDWQITGENDGRINDAIDFTDFHNLTGNSGDDDFTLASGGSVTGTINGGTGGSNSLTAGNVANAWLVDDANEGTVTGVTRFEAIGTLIGNGDIDNFVIGASGSLTGGIQGAGSNDSLTLTSGTHVWNVTGMNDGNLAVINTFDSIETLVGGSGEDTFNVADTAGASVLLDGGAGDSDELNVSGFTSNVAVNLEANTVNGMAVAGFEAYTANAAMDNTLTGASGANDWQITGENDGRINDAIDFTDFHNLTGNSGDDDFTLASGGSVTGTINGGTGGSNSLRAGDVVNTWTITGTDSGVVTGVGLFNAIQNLIGGALANTFTLQGGNITGNITGGSSDDTLNADNFANTWTITADNAGQVTGVANFTSIENLVGGTSTDDFTFADGTVVASVDGGTSGIDTMYLTDYTTPVEFNLALGLVAGMSASNIDNVVVDNGLDNTLVGADAINDWSITGLNSGTLNGVGFTGFANLTGGGLADTFALNGGSVTGLVNGALGDDELIAATTGSTFVLTALNAGTAANTGGFTGIENLTGNDGVDSFELAGGALTGNVDGMGGVDDTLIADNVNNTWDIARAGGGDVTGLGQFDGIENLTGNLQEDVFNFNGGSIAGDINGVDGDDTINAADVANTFVIDGSDTGTATNVGGRFIEIDNLNGGAGVDTFTLQAGGTLSGSINGGDEVDTLNAGPVANEFVVDVTNGGTVTGISGRFDAIENLVGNSDIDRFTVDATLDGYIDGRGNMDVLTAGDRSNTFEITSENDGNATGIAGGFIDVESIVGNGDTDDFYLMGGTLSGTIDGAGGVNSLTADAVVSSFVVNVNNGGTATGLGSGTADPDDGFANIQNLVGNSEADTFALAGGVLDGTIDGAGALDTLVGDNVVNVFTVLTNDSGTATGLGGGTTDPDDGFTNIENLTGNAQNDSFILDGGVLSGVVDGAGGDADSFTANDVDNVFEVLTDNQGIATGLGGGTVASNDGFVNVETLISRSGDDTFTLNGGTLAGYIDGGANDDTFYADDVANIIEVTAPNQGSATGLAGGLADGFRGIENIIGNDQSDNFTINGGSIRTIDGGGLTDTLAVVSATGQAVTWSIDEQNNGLVDGVTVGFISFENLEGGAGNDSFTFAGADLINVDVIGGEGADTFNVQSVVNGSLQGQGGNDIYNFYDDVILNDVDGGLGDDRFVLQAGAVDVTVEGNDGSDTLEVAHALDNTWTINAIDDRVQDGAGGTARFRNVETLQGGDGVDTFNITAAFVGDIIAGANADIINLFATVTGVINGGDEDDRFNVNNVGIAADLVGGTGEDAIYVTHDDANVWTIDVLGNQVADQSGGVVTFDEMDLLVGNVRIDTFNVNTPFVGRLDGQDNDDIFNLGANVDDTDELRVDVLGGAGNDVFNLTQLNVTTTIDGQAGNDSVVVAHGFSSNWILDGVDNRVTDTAGGATRFDSIETAVGGDAIDTFNIGATFTGRIFGGANDDEFNIGADVDDSNVLTQDIVGGEGEDTFRIATTGLTVSLDGGTEDDLLVVDHTENVAWIIDGVNDRVTDADGGLVGFVGIDSLLGGTGVDVFTITAELTGSLDGRDSDDIFNLAANVNSTVYGGFGNDVFNIDTTGLTLNLNGGAGTDTVVTAHDQVATWQLDGTNNRVEDTASGTAGFDAVEIAQGGDGVDTFNVTSTFIGQLNGAGSDDVFNLTANVTDGNALTADIVGGTGDDTVNLNAAGLVVSVDAGEGLADAVVIGHANSSTWMLDGTNNRVEDDAAGATTFDNVEIAQGNDNVDQFIVTAPFVGRILGQGGDDVFTLAANVSDSNILTDDVLGGLGNDQFSIEVSGLQLSINGDDGADDQISIGHTADTQWVVDGNNNRITDADSALITFDGLENLQGGSGDDVIEVLAEVAGDIDGRGGNDQFIIGANVTGDVSGGAGDDVFSVTAPSLTLNVIGDLGSDSLEIAYNDTHTWFIDGVSDRVEDSVTGVTIFNGMEMLFGSEGADTFNITTLFQGRIDARGNSDTFNLSAAVSDNLDNTDDLLGGDGDDTFNLLVAGLSVSIDAQGGTDSLAAADATNVWLIGTTNTLNNRIEFAGLENYIGGVQDDTFVMEAGAQANIIRGAAVGATELAEDALIITHAAADSAVWRISALDEGSIDGQLNGFTSIENITGGEGSDTFVFLNDTAFMTGLIDGSTSSDLITAGNDTVRLEMLTSGVTVELGTDTTSDNLHVVNIENIIAAEDPLPADADDTEAANRLVNNQNGNYQWVISDRNVGRIEPIVAASEENTVNFEHFGTIEAGLGEDIFLFEGAGYISGEIIGGSGNNTANYSNSLGDIVIRVGTGGISGFTTIIGNNDGSSDALPNATLQIVDGDNTWFIEDTSASPLLGVNEGRFTDGAGGTTDFTFANFNNIQGGSGQDTFILNDSATITGVLDGGSNLASQPDIFNSTNATVGVNVQVGGSTFGTINVTNIEELSANVALASSNTLFASDTTNTWIVDGIDAGELNGVLFDGFANLVGTAGTDTFTLDGVDRITGLIDGAGGANDLADLSGLDIGDDITVELTNVVNSDIDVFNIANVETVQANPGATNTFVALDRDNSWTINDVNAGLIERTGDISLDSNVAFSGFSQLVGGANTDDVTFTSAGVVSGSIDTGLGDSDRLDVSALTDDVRVGLGVTAVADVNVINVETIVANPTNTNTLIADEQNNSFEIQGINSGELNSTVAFENFANIEGRDMNDQVRFDAGAVLDGYIDLASQPEGGIDRIDMSALSQVNVTVGLGDTHVRGAEQIIGNGVDSTLTVSELITGAGNTWLIDGQQDAGSVNSEIAFEGMNNLTGSINDDVFTVTNGGSVTGIISGAEGNDQFIVDWTTVIPVTTIVGGDGSDSLQLSGNLTGLQGEYTPQVATNLVAGAEQLLYTDGQSTNYTVDFVSVESVVDNVLADSFVINGTNGINELRFAESGLAQTNEFSLNILDSDGLEVQTFADIQFTDKYNVVAALGGTDTFVVDGDLFLNGGSLEVTNALVDVVNTEAELVTDSLILTNVAGVGGSANPWLTRVNDLSVSATGDVYIRERDSVVINALDMSNDAAFVMDLAFAGNISTTAPLNSAGPVSLTTPTGDIVLDQDNNLTGELTLVASGDVVVNNTQTTTLAQVTAENFVLTANGVSDVDGGAVQVNNLTTLNITGDATLDSNLNSFNRVTVAAVDTLNLVDGDLLGLTVEGVEATGAVAIQSTGMTVDGAITASTISLDAAAGALDLNAQLSTEGAAGQSDIALTAGTVNQFVDVVAQDNIIVTATGDYTMAEETLLSAIDGGVNLDATGFVNMETVTAQQDIVIASADQGVRLNQAVSSQDGDVSLSANTTVEMLADVTAQSGIQISTLTGDVVQQGNLNVQDGDLNISAGNDLQMGVDTRSDVGLGSISISAGNDVVVTELSVGGTGSETSPEIGRVTIDALGAIVNGGTEGVNITSDTVVMDAVTGVGSGSAVTVAVNRLSAGNDGFNETSINLVSTQAVVVERIHNNGDISLTVNNGDLLIDNTNYGEYTLPPRDFNEGDEEIDANIAGGIIDAGYREGDVFLTAMTGNINVIEGTSFDQSSTQPVIAGQNAIVTAVEGQSGSAFDGRRLSFFVDDTIILQGRAASRPILAFYSQGYRPRVVDNRAEFQPDLASLLLENGDLLVEVESIEAVNPAVFSEVRNYSHDQVSILMPKDQRYDDDEDDEYEDEMY